MYVEKDNTGRIIIQDIIQDEATLLADCIRSYLSGKPLEGRTDMERRLIFLRVELEKVGRHGFEAVQAE